jgi:hypothetical protein
MGRGADADVQVELGCQVGADPGDAVRHRDAASHPRPGCPGQDDLPPVRRAASGQVVDGPASVPKASTRGTHGRILRP